MGSVISRLPTPANDDKLLQRIRLLEEKVLRLEQLLQDSHKPGDTTQSTTSQTEKQQAPVAPEPAPAPRDFRVHWKDTIRFDTNDGDFKLQIGGRIQNDWAFYSQDSDLKSAFSNEQDGTKIRRARLRLAGSLYEDYSFMVQYDFAGGDADIKNAWLAANNVPLVGRITVGQFKEPIGLEVLANSNDTTFMEFALPSVFYPLHRTGLGVSNNVLDKRMSWATGVFRNTNTYGDRSADGEYNLTTRITGLPWYQDEGQKLLHLGAAYSRRSFNDPVQIRQRPESNLTQNFYLDTGMFDADNADITGIEAALVYGSLSFQAEHTRASYDTAAGGSEVMNGYYGQVSYFLTGEHRPYNKTKGTFGRIRPENNFQITSGNGIGAWELALRYSSLDLNDGILQGGKEDNTTLGLNWYLNPSFRILLNYVHAEIDSPLTKGDIDALQTRFQIQF